MAKLPTESLYDGYISCGQYQTLGIADYDRWASAAEWRFGNWLPRQVGSRCLDLGSGCGQVLYMLRRFGYTDIRGIDFSRECVTQAQAMNLPVEYADVTIWLDSSPLRFDVIFAVDLLEHIEKSSVVSLLRQIIEHLADGGVFIAQTVNGESPMFGQIRYGDFTHENTFTQQSLSALLRHVGFDEIQFKPVGPYPGGFVSFLRAALWKGVEVLVKMWNLIETGGNGSAICTRNLILLARKKSTRP